MFPTFKRNKTEKGISVIEIFVVTAVTAIAMAALLDLTSFSLRTSTLIRQTTAANELAREAMEAVRNFRDTTLWNENGLGKLATSTDYFPRATGTPEAWQLVLGEESSGIFERKIVFEDVMRDGNHNIVAAGGTFDPDTKKITAIVSWMVKNGTRQVKLVTYLTNWRR